MASIRSMYRASEDTAEILSRQANAACEHLQWYSSSSGDADLSCTVEDARLPFNPPA